MMRPFILSIIFAFLLVPSNGQESNLSLSDALKNALENNYGIILSRAEADIASINNSWANAGRYPVLGFDLSSINNQNITDDSFSGRLNAGIGLNWTIFDGFKVNLTKEKLDRLEDLAQGRTSLVVESTIEDIILAYYLVLLNRERLYVLESVMKLSEDRYNYELSRKEFGSALSYNVLQAKNNYLGDKASHLNQEAVYRNSVRNLNFLMGEESSSLWAFADEFSVEAVDYTLADLQDKMFSGNVSLSNQYISILLAENKSELVQSDYFPSLRLSAGLDNSNIYSPDSQRGSGISAYGNVTLSIDIYQAGQRKRATEISRVEESIAGIEEEELKRSLINQLFNLHDNYSVRKELLDLSLENYEAAKLNMSIAEEKYKSGAINSFNYRDIQLIYLDASYRELEAIYNLIVSQTALTRITGGLLSSQDDTFGE